MIAESSELQQLCAQQTAECIQRFAIGPFQTIFLDHKSGRIRLKNVKKVMLLILEMASGHKSHSEHQQRLKKLIPQVLKTCGID